MASCACEAAPVGLAAAVRLVLIVKLRELKDLAYIRASWSKLIWLPINTMPSPEDVLSQRDPGDDMQRRLRYQAAYGALLCLELLDGQDFAEVFCEHHEDFLVKKLSGKYSGVQVKTREAHLGPFRSNESMIVGALTRFVKLDLEFPNYFASFIIVANCDFLDDGSKETNLPHVIRVLRAKPTAAFPGAMGIVIDNIRTELGCSKKRIRDVLRRVELEGNPPKFEDITMSVATKIGRSDGFNSRMLPDLYKGAQSLIDHIQRCAGLTCDLPVRTHFVFASSPAEEFAREIITHKQINKTIVEHLLVSSLPGVHPLLTSQAHEAAELPNGHHLLEKKMALGGISFDSIDIAKDHQASTEYLLQSWIHTYGVSIATARFEHVDVLVRTRCAEAHDEAYLPGSQFGADMLARLRSKLQHLASQKEDVFGARYEHLLGFASMSTQKCKTWWSDRVNLGGES